MRFSYRAGVVAVVVSLAVLTSAEKDCVSLKGVNSKHRECIGDMFDINLDKTATEILSKFQDGCAHVDEYRRCMEEFADGCVYKDIIIAQAQRKTNVCDGTRVAGWFQHYIIPAFERVKQSCRKEGFGIGQSCIDFLLGLKIQAGRKIAQALSDNVFKEGFWACYKEDTQRDIAEKRSCAGQSWKDVFVINMSYMFIHPGSFILNMDKNHISEIKEMVKQKNLLELLNITN